MSLNDIVPAQFIDPSEPKQKRKPGRPKGAAQQNFLTLRYWFTLMQNDMKDMKPYQRAVLATKMMQTLLAHDKHLEKDPNKRDRNKSNELDEDTLLKHLEGTSDLNKS